jgi:aryl-alcohol dehydrogenase-like predicted oxidoreductase
MSLAETKGVTANQIAVAYLLSQPFPVYPIIGTTNAGHLRDAMGASDLRLTAEQGRRLFS